jgi:hypothetical protein
MHNDSVRVIPDRPAGWNLELRMMRATPVVLHKTF